VPKTLSKKMGPNPLGRGKLNEPREPLNSPKEVKKTKTVQGAEQKPVIR